MPLVAGLSYEIIRYSAKKESGAIFKFMTLPGLWLQNITTQEPEHHTHTHYHQPVYPVEAGRYVPLSGVARAKTPDPGP